MTTAPTEINAAAIKNGPTEKHTPMMQQYPGVTLSPYEYWALLDESRWQSPYTPLR